MYTSEKYIKESIIKIIKQQFNNNLDFQILEDTNFNDIDIDSIDRINIVISLEEEFEIDIKDEDAEKWETVKDIINYIKERINVL